MDCQSILVRLSRQANALQEFWDFLRQASKERVQMFQDADEVLKKQVSHYSTSVKISFAEHSGSLGPIFRVVSSVGEVTAKLNDPVNFVSVTFHRNSSLVFKDELDMYYFKDFSTAEEEKIMLVCVNKQISEFCTKHHAVDDIFTDLIEPQIYPKLLERYDLEQSG